MLLSILYFRGHELHSEDPTHLVGIYSRREAAIEVGRAMCMHEDDEYSVHEIGLDRIDSGTNIWCRDCDTNPEMRSMFARYWPMGFPVVYPDVCRS